MSTVKSQLEDLVFQTLNPVGYKQIESKIKSTNRDREAIIKKVIKPLEEEISKYGIRINIYGERNHIHQFMGKLFQEIKNLMKFMIYML